jgi:hypothetical protein
MIKNASCAVTENLFKTPPKAPPIQGGALQSVS